MTCSRPHPLPGGCSHVHPLSHIDICPPVSHARIPSFALYIGFWKVSEGQRPVLSCSVADFKCFACTQAADELALVASSCFGAALFAAHPVHTEAVTGIVGRCDVMCLSFYLTAFACYVRLTGTLRPLTHALWLGGFVVCYICALLSKEAGVTVAALCLFYDVLIPHKTRLVNAPALEVGRQTGAWGPRVLRLVLLLGLGLGYVTFRSRAMGTVDLRDSLLIRKVENPFLFAEGLPRLLSLAYLQVIYVRSVSACPISASAFPIPVRSHGTISSMYPKLLPFHYHQLPCHTSSGNGTCVWPLSSSADHIFAILIQSPGQPSPQLSEHGALCGGSPRVRWSWVSQTGALM